jgi:hypothetical protein
VAIEDSTTTNMPKSPGAILHKRYEKMLTQRRQWEPSWRDIASYIMPRRISSIEQRQPGAKQTERLFDSTAIFSNEVLAASLQGSITNQAVKWLSLRVRDFDVNTNDEAAEWLDRTADKMLLSLRQSNFASEVHELYLDLGAFGTGVVLIEEHMDIKGDLLFTAIPIGTYVIAEGRDGKVNTIFYEIRLSYAAAAAKWGQKNLSRDSLKKMREDADQEFTVIHAVYPRDTVAKGLRGRKPFVSVHYEKENRHIIRTGGYNRFPFVVPRWVKASGEVYGRSPGFTTLPDVKTLNKVIELELRSWAKAIDPPVMVQDRAVVGSLKFQPGGVTVVRDMNGLKELITNARFDVSEIKKDEIRAAIKGVFFVDQMLQLMARDTPQMTATEVQVKVQLLQQILGPTFGRLESELLNPLVDRVFEIMDSANKFDAVPDILNEQQLDVEYEGPLARSQRTQELLGIERTLTVVQLMATFDPTVLDRIDSDEIVKLTADIAGAPRQIIRSDEATNKIKEERARQQEMAENMEATETAAGAAGKVVPAVKAISEAMTGRTNGAAK